MKETFRRNPLLSVMLARATLFRLFHHTDSIISHDQLLGYKTTSKTNAPTVRDRRPEMWQSAATNQRTMGLYVHGNLLRLSGDGGKQENGDLCPTNHRLPMSYRSQDTYVLPITGYLCPTNHTLRLTTKTI